MVIGEFSANIIEFDAGNRPIFSVPFHFDVSGHKLSLDSFVRTSQEYDNLFDAFNHEIFSGQLQYKLYVFAPEKGSFKSNLGIVLIAGFGALTATMMGDFGAGVVTGLTGKPAAEWGEVLGETIRDSLEANSENEISQTDVENAIAVGVLVETTERFLEAQTSELLELGITPEMLPESFVAKNDFYDALELDPRISGISFGEEPSDPIKREDFALRNASVSPVDRSVWEFQTAKYFVYSPNWNRDDKHRGWKGHDSKELTVHFSIYDPGFWDRYESGEINSGTIDELVVQVALRVIDGRIKNRIVLNVVSYNDDKLADEMPQEEISERLRDAGY